jgi:hypothetical protein
MQNENKYEVAKIAALRQWAQESETVASRKEGKIMRNETFLQS